MGDVTLNGITKRYADVVAVEDMNLEIEHGEFVTLVGPSGCGKSTTMKTVAGLTSPTEGTVFIDGEEVTPLPPKDRGVAMVFQNIALFPHMDVFDNVSFGLRIRDYDDAEVETRVERAAETVQMEGMLDRMPDELSGGQRQRVAIARAIVREPEAFLMDEPLANLDAKLRVRMRTELQRLHRELDTTIIYVTHNQAEAMTMSDRIAVIDDGTLQQIAPPLVCYDEPANRFVAGFIGSPSMNFMDGQLTADGFTARDGRIDLRLDPASVGLSPGEGVTLTEDGLQASTGVYPLDLSEVRSERPTERDPWTQEARVTADGKLEDADSEPLDIDVSQYVVEAGDDVSVGVRPEDVYPADEAPEHGTDPIDAVTDVLEPMGDEVFVYLRFDDGDGGAQAGNPTTEQLLMSVDPHSDIEADEPMSVVLDQSKLHLFGPNGRALSHGLMGADHGDAGVDSLDSEVGGVDE